MPIFRVARQSGADQKMEAMAGIYRAQIGRGQKKASQNAYKHGGHCANMRQLNQIMTEYVRLERELLRKL